MHPRIRYLCWVMLDGSLFLSPALERFPLLRISHLSYQFYPWWRMMSHQCSICRVIGIAQFDISSQSGWQFPWVHNPGKERGWGVKLLPEFAKVKFLIVFMGDGPLFLRLSGTLQLSKDSSSPALKGNGTGCHCNWMGNLKHHHKKSGNPVLCFLEFPFLFSPDNVAWK